MRRVWRGSAGSSRFGDGATRPSPGPWHGAMYDASHTESIRSSWRLTSRTRRRTWVDRLHTGSRSWSALPVESERPPPTTPLSYEAVFKVRVIDATSGAVPLVVSIWAPFENAKWQVEFSDTPDREITLQRVERDLVTQSELIGNYEIGVPYTVSIVVDRDPGAAYWCFVRTMSPSRVMAGQSIRRGELRFPT